MARTRTGPTLVEVLVILAVSAVLIILLTLTINRVRQTLAEASPSPIPDRSSHRGADVKHTVNGRMTFSTREDEIHT